MGIFLVICRSGYAQQIKLGVDYLIERKEETEKESTYNFIQVYDVILQKRLFPLYDLKLKFQFRSERGEEDKDRLQVLPALSFQFGNRVVGLNLGMSKDNIQEKDRKYDLDRGYSTFIWSPYYLPKLTIQYQSEKTDFSRDLTDEPDEEEESDLEKRLVIRDDYRLVIGIFEFNHSYSWEKRKVWEEETGTIDYYDRDLYNKGRLNYQLTALDSRLQLNSDYEISQHDKTNKEADNEYKAIEQKVNLRVNGTPRQQVKLYYNVFLGELQDRSDDNRQRTVTNSLKTEVLPYQYLKTILEISHDNQWETEDETRRSTLLYGLRLEPEIPGLLFDPNTSLPPIQTSFLLSSALNKNNGDPDYRTNTALLKGSTQLYKGFEIRTDFEVINKKSYNEDEQWEKNLGVDASLDLRDDLTYYFKNENTWRTQEQEGASYSIKNFEGEVWNSMTYRPADRFFLTLENNIKYGDIENTLYGYRVGWAPAPKLRLEARYRSDDIGEDQYFSSEMNINITNTLKFRIKYSYPSDDQVISFRLTLKT